MILPGGSASVSESNGFTASTTQHVHIIFVTKSFTENVHILHWPHFNLTTHHTKNVSTQIKIQ